uniref:Uncharacterized protein n=1 Tax=Prolemur simus TaxID=1328070 RepID=A0A8C9B010_PROSS
MQNPLLRTVAAMPEDRKPGPNPYGSPWELVGCAAAGFLAALFFVWRRFPWARSRLSVRRQTNLAMMLCELAEEKGQILEKLSLFQEESEDLESSFPDASFGKQSTQAQSLEATYKKLNRSQSELEDAIRHLAKEIKEEKSKHAQQDDLLADITKRLRSLGEESKSLKSQVAGAKTTVHIFQMNAELLKMAIKVTSHENSQLQEHQKQLLQEAEAWKEQVNELKKRKVTLEDSEGRARQVLNEKENHIKSLCDHLLKLKDWAAVLGEDTVEGENLESGRESESDKDAHCHHQPRGALKKLLRAAELNASFRALERERRHIYTQLSEVDKTKEALAERVKKLWTEQASLEAENTQLESEKQKLQQKLEAMTELYQENTRKLHRKLTAEENDRLEKEEKLSKVDGELSRAAEELETYRQRVADLEEHSERIVHFYQGKILSYEKKARDNWLAAQAAERKLNDFRKENSHHRQKLAETEFQSALLRKDPRALHVPNRAFGRQHAPRGPSPWGRPSSARRAFVSPPTWWRGPRTLSPVLEEEEEEAQEAQGINPLDHQITKETRESNCERLTEPHRVPSATGHLLSHAWEQAGRRGIPPRPALPPQRQDRLYSHFGRQSALAEVRSFNMPSLDKMDEPVSLEMESSRSDTKDDPATGPGFAPAPLPAKTGPLFPLDVRGPFVRRQPRFPPPPPGNTNVYSPRRSLPYIPPRPAFFSTPLHSQSRNDFSLGLMPPSNKPINEPPEPQQKA